MPTCSRCHRSFPVGQKRCPDDDTVLEATAAEIAVGDAGTMAVPGFGANPTGGAGQVARAATTAPAAVTERKAIGTAETAAFDVGDHAKAIAAAKAALAEPAAAPAKRPSPLLGIAGAAVLLLGIGLGVYAWSVSSKK